MSTYSNEEISLIEIIKKIYISKKIILRLTTLFIIIGIIISLVSPIKYSSSTIFISQNQNSSPSLSGVASLVGINLGNSPNGNEIPITLYPKIAESTKFKRLLLETSLEEEYNLTLKSYLIKYYELDNTNDKTYKSNIYISKLEDSCFKILENIISIDIDQREGFITINSVMPVAKYSAIVSNTSKEILQRIIIENKIESAKQNLIFSEKQLFEKKKEFDEIQKKLSSFEDSNINMVNSSLKGERDKLEAEFQIISSVVSELSRQVEQSKLQVSKDTPVFSTIQEATIPNARISPNRRQIVILFSFFGLILSITFLFTREIFFKIINELKE